MNAIRNLLGLLYLFFFIITLGLLYYVATPILNGAHDAVQATLPNPGSDTIYLNSLSVKSIMIQGFYVVVSLIIFFSLISSIIEQGTLMDYLINAFGSLILTPLAIYFIATFWNTFSSVGYIFPDIQMVFINNYTTILALNLFCGLMSFIFMKKATTGASMA